MQVMFFARVIIYFAEVYLKRQKRGYSGGGATPAPHSLVAWLKNLANKCCAFYKKSLFFQYFFKVEYCAVVNQEAKKKMKVRKRSSVNL